MKRKYIILIVLLLVLIIVTILSYKWIKDCLTDNSSFDREGRLNPELNKVEDYYNIDSITLTDIYWYTDYDTLLNQEFIVKGRLLDSLSQSPDELIHILNRRKQKSKIEYVDIMNDTILIKILNDEYLTEQMGTTGAYCFLGETVFTLTEGDLIKYVKIDMNVGSHAGPGVYSRNDFKDLLK